MSSGEFISDEHIREIGEKLGEVIRLQVEIIALLSNVEPEDVFEQLVEHYVAQRIIDGAE